jgi:DNA uptake protein ComE-like DNA-binding protein
MRGRRQFCVVLFCCVFLSLVCASIEAKKKPPLHPINLNTANAEQLQEVQGIGPATADKILKMRKS